LKFSVGADPVREIEILPGVWMTLITWATLNFTMGFVGVKWPNIWFHAAMLIGMYVIILYNVTVDNRCLVDIYLRRNRIA
jgi:hypothetical protein